jgi:hypothetical protein
VSAFLGLSGRKEECAHLRTTRCRAASTSASNHLAEGEPARDFNAISHGILQSNQARVDKAVAYVGEHT